MTPPSGEGAGWRGRVAWPAPATENAIVRVRRRADVTRICASKAPTGDGAST